MDKRFTIITAISALLILVWMFWYAHAPSTPQPTPLPEISYYDMVGKTFVWNGNNIIISNIGSDGKFELVILPSTPNQIATLVAADRKQLKEAYQATLTPEKK